MSQTSPWLWLATVALLCLVWWLVAWFRGPQKAIGVQVLLAALVPTWAQLELGDSLWLDCRMAATIFGLGAYCFHPKATWPVKLGWLDACMISLLLIHAASEVKNENWSLAVPVRIYGEWCVAYLAGRLAMQTSEDFRFMTPVAVTVGVVLAAGSIFEATTGWHPWEWLYGERKLDGIDRGATRWIGTRAWGCCAHPIYFGFLQVMFLPWLLRAWHRTRATWKLAWVNSIWPFFGMFGLCAPGRDRPWLLMPW